MSVMYHVCNICHLSRRPTLHSHKVQGSFSHRSPSVRSCPVLSVHSVLLRRFSSRLICFFKKSAAVHHFTSAVSCNRSIRWENYAWTTCFRKLVIVCCISETKSWKSLMEGLVLFLEVTVMFPRLSLLPLVALQKHAENWCHLLFIHL